LVRRNIFHFLWLLASVGFALFLYQGHRTFDSPYTIYVLIGLLFCTVALISWFPNPVIDPSSEWKTTRRGWYFLAAILLIVILFLARTIVGPSLLFAWPIIGVAVLIVLKPDLPKQEVVYAVVLALIAGLTGLGAGWVPFHPIIWSVLQVCLVFTGLVAGWALIRHSGLWAMGVCRSQFLDEGLTPALRSAFLGMLIAIPWGLGIVLLGGAESQDWVHSWWQPFMAISAGIGEEVWGRVFPIPLLFLLLRRIVRPRRAYLYAIIIMSYWFAYLHTSGGFEGLISMVMIGTLYSIPITYVCMHRDLETAIGFHFFVDFIKFVAAFYMNSGEGYLL
jgi:hypothetical protein